MVQISVIHLVTMIYILHTPSRGGITTTYRLGYIQQFHDFLQFLMSAKTVKRWR